MNQATEQLKTNNMKLKGLLNQVQLQRPCFLVKDSSCVYNHDDIIWQHDPKHHCTTWVCSLMGGGCVVQMRSSRNFCLDVVLICILLGLAVYLVELFKKKG